VVHRFSPPELAPSKRRLRRSRTRAACNLLVAVVYQDEYGFTGANLVALCPPARPTAASPQRVLVLLLFECIYSFFDPEHVLHALGQCF